MTDEGVKIQSQETLPDDPKQHKRDQFIYPINQLGGGTLNAFFPTFLPLLLNTVYFFTVGVAGFVEIINQITQWLAQPLAGAIIDRFQFKKAKYWPWFLIGSVGTGICWIVIFGIPSIAPNPSALMLLIAGIVIINGVLQGTGNAMANAMFALVAKDGRTRSMQAMWGKVAREAIRTIVGMVFPLMIIFFMSRGFTEVNSWSFIAIILAGFAIVLQCIVAYLTKKSRPEQEAMQANAAIKMRRAPLSKTLAAIFTNRALLSIWLANSLLKVFFFYHIIGGFLLWRYFFGNWAMMAVYMTAISICSTAGALATPFVYRITKDAKLGAIVSIIGQIALYIVALFVVSPENMMGTVILISCVMLFNGLSDAFMQPLFAHAADYSILKSGSKDYGLNMTAFGLSITTGIMVSTATRTAALASAGYDGATIEAAAARVMYGIEWGGGPMVPRALAYLQHLGYSVTDAAAQIIPGGVMQQIRNINSIYPLIICVVILLILLFVYPLNDKKVLEIQAQIAERDAAAAAAEGAPKA